MKFKSILFGQIQVPQLRLFPDNGTGGGNGNGNQQQQQQQQQPPPTEPDPFADIDRSMLDDATRQQIERAEARFATLANQAQTAQTTAEQLQQAQAQLQQIQEQITRGDLRPAHQQQQQPPQHQGPPDMLGELTQYYIAQGLEPAQAEKVAKMNEGAFGVFGKHLTQGMQQHLQPYLGNVVDNSAKDAFEHVRQNDALGAMDIPEVAQAVWDRSHGMAESGQIVNPEVVANLARIEWAKHIEQFGMPNTPTQQQYQPPTNYPPMNPHQPQPQPQPIRQLPNVQQQQQTRFTYPGAGAHVRVPNFRGGAPNGALPADPDTQAAVAATVAEWPVKPQAFRNGKR